MCVGQYKPNLRIAELRKKKGMTQAELGEKADLGPSGRSQIAKFETGDRIPTWDTLVKLAGALGCRTVNQLFGTMLVSKPPPRGAEGSPTRATRPL